MDNKVKTYSRRDFMKIAIEEHSKCTEFPRVGAVIAKDGIILSTGYRGERADIHAERVAIEKLSSEQLHSSILYTTLEPCVALLADQTVESCADLIIKSGISEVVIGVLDLNGSVYSQGFGKLLEHKIRVSFFNRKLRAAVEEETFEYGEIDKLVGSGKRCVPVVNSGISLTVQFSKSDLRTIDFRWGALQPNHNCVDLLGDGDNKAIRIASGAVNFSNITDPMVFKLPSHYARMKKGMIAIVKPNNASFCILVKLLELYQNDILFQWEVRNC
jgi:diaminohydroxyphosphoribosylaminopyrimidine deaminase/5-amino-6-(5-phosphoribosylamino)uracil reductase